MSKSRKGMSPEQLEVARAHDKRRRQDPKVKAKAKAHRDAYYAKHGEEMRARNRELWAKRMEIDGDYWRAQKKIANRFRLTGWSGTEFTQAWAFQGGRCDICGVEMQDDGNKKPTSVASDHCHATNRIRALICYSCNNGLGFFRDRPDVLRAAATYLETDHQAIRQRAKLALVG